MSITKDEICKKLTGIGWANQEPFAQTIAQYAALVISNLQHELELAQQRNTNGHRNSNECSPDSNGSSLST